LKFLKKLSDFVVPKLKRDKLIDLNTASVKEILTIPPINGSNIDVILSARPIKYLDVLVGVGGIRSSHIDVINTYVTQKRETPDVPIINLNMDSIHRINTLPAISKKKARAIIDGRPYEFLEDIVDVKGISDKTIQELVGLVKPDSINAINDFGEPVDINLASFTDLITIPFVSSNTANVLLKNRPIDYLDEFKPHLSHKEILRIQPYTVQKVLNLTEERKLIDLNTASVELIEELPGIGEKSAILIYDNAPYKYLDDLIHLFSYKVLSNLNLYTVQDFKAHNTGVIDLNEATLGQIAAIPNLTSAKAQIIFDNTPYKYLDELAELKGITENTLQLIEDFVTQEFEDKDSSLIDLNKASLLLLQTLPEVGEIIAAKILAARKANSIDHLDDLVESKTITKKLAKTINEFVLQVFRKDDEGLSEDGLIDLNTASVDTLDSLPNVGPKSAQKIVDIRPIKFLEDLLDLSGIDLKTIQSFEKLVVQKYRFIQKEGEVNLNTATIKDISNIPGIGKVKAKTIFNNKPYRFLEELIGFKGITLDFLKTIEKHVVPKLKGISDSDRIDLNKATETKILTLRGVGKKAAKTIIKHRPYKELIELINRAKLSRKLVIKIKDFVLPKLQNDDGLRIDINKASAATMLPLPGIGEKNVKNLIKHRPYKILDDLIKVDGFTLGTIKRFKDFVLPRMENENVIDLNKAKTEDIQKLPSISDFMASYIIKMRPIEYLDDLKAIMSVEQIKKIQDRVIQKFKDSDSDEAGLVDLNTATLPQILQIPLLEEHKIVAEYLYKERPFKYLDDAIHVTGMTKNY
jgi:DNA uptake protein and related DNA-binding proteins